MILEMIKYGCTSQQVLMKIIPIMMNTSKLSDRVIDIAKFMNMII